MDIFYHIFEKRMSKYVHHDKNKVQTVCSFWIMTGIPHWLFVLNSRISTLYILILLFSTNIQYTYLVDGISDIWLQIVVQRSPLVYIYLKPLCNKFWQETRSTSNSRWRMAAILNSRSNMLLWNKILLMQVQYI